MDARMDDILMEFDDIMYAMMLGIEIPVEISPKPISLYHRHEGGTAVENFDKWDATIYKLAIVLYGDPNFVVVEKPMHVGDGVTLQKNVWSLHYRGNLRDLSEFWDVFNSVNAVFKAMKNDINDCYNELMEPKRY